MSDITHKKRKMEALFHGHEGPVEELLDRLKEIQHLTALYHPVDESLVYSMPNILFLIFCIGKECLNFKDELKQEIGSLLVKAIEPIKLYIEEVVHSYIGRNPFVLQNRSALEYLIKDFGTFPAGGTTLLCKLEEANIIDSITILDENIEENRNIVSFKYGDWDFDVFGGFSVPDSHDWWPKEYPLKMAESVHKFPCTSYSEHS